MSNSNIAENNNNLTKTCSILLTVIFFILSFLTGFNNIVIFVLGVLLLGLVFLLSMKSFKGLNYYALGIVLIPVVSYGVIMSLGYFSNAYYSVTTRIFLTLNMLLFLLAGYFSIKIKLFDFKWIFTAIFASLSVICLVNLIATSVCFGPFHGLRLTDYYSYYNGASSRNPVSGSAYALCGYSIKEVPVEYYLFYPFLLLSSIFFYLFGDRKNRLNIISSASFVLIGLISIIFVISKLCLPYVIIYSLFIVVVSALILYKKLYGKVFKYTMLAIASLSFIGFVIFFINSQFILTGFRNAIGSNKFTNYLFNTNRYLGGARVVLDEAFSNLKLIGFPIYFDYNYEAYCVPSINIIVNQFMYGGIFGFLFFIVLIAIFVYVFISNKKLNIDNKVYKYAPLLFVISYFAITMIMDQNIFNVFSYSYIFANYLSPFFYISLFVYGHYYSLINQGVTKVEK